MIVALILAVWLIGVPVAVLAAGELCRWRSDRARRDEHAPAASPVVIVVGGTGSLVAGRTGSGRGCEARRRSGLVTAPSLRGPRRV